MPPYTLNVTKGHDHVCKGSGGRKSGALAVSTERKNTLKFSKTKCQLCLTCLLGSSVQSAPVRPHFQNVASIDCPSHFYFALTRKNGQKERVRSLQSNTDQCLRRLTDVQSSSMRSSSRRSSMTDQRWHSCSMRANAELALALYHCLSTLATTKNSE